MIGGTSDWAANRVDGNDFREMLLVEKENPLGQWMAYRNFFTCAHGD